MLKIAINKEFKSIKAPIDCELPSFTILIGKNGSGKSHFLEAVNNIGSNTINGTPVGVINYLPFGSLHPSVNETSLFQNLLSRQKETWRIVKVELERLKLEPNISDKFEQALVYISDKRIRKYIADLYELSEQNIASITEDMFNSIYQLPDNLISSELAEIFMLYHRRLDDNFYKDYQNQNHGTRKKSLPLNQFESKFGPKPWGLMNELFQKAHLPYEVNNPEALGRDDDYHLKLVNTDTLVEIQFNDLSTGEKVLAYLAISVYNTKSRGAKPDILLFDEPDAALHPEFSKLFIDIVRNVIVETAGICVIMTTHSPTTVAVANEADLYEMSKSESKPIKISKQRGLTLLTQDLDNIRLTADNRRQIFVESKYDVGYYEKIHQLLTQTLSTRLLFLAPHNRDGSNCTDVITITNSLSVLGNDLVYGIIDFDMQNKSQEKVLVLGEGNRYSIENYIFDPIFVGFLLVRERIISDKDFPSIKFSDIKNASDEDLQQMINYILNHLNLIHGKMAICKTVSGKEFSISKSFLLCKGHELENKILSAWPGINAIKKGKTEDNVLKNYVLDKVIFEYPDFLSNDFMDLFEKIK